MSKLSKFEQVFPKKFGNASLKQIIDLIYVLRQVGRYAEYLLTHYRISISTYCRYESHNFHY